MGSIHQRCVASTDALSWHERKIYTHFTEVLDISFVSVNASKLKLFLFNLTMIDQKRGASRFSIQYNTMSPVNLGNTMIGKKDGGSQVSPGSLIQGQMC